MKNTLGNKVQLTIFGESHGDAVGIVVNGFPMGVRIDFDFMKKQMDKRRSSNKLSTPRQEQDDVQILSGLMNGVTTGAPCCFLIRNTNQNSKDYEEHKDIARPSHIDYVTQQRYQGYQDYRGSGHFSGRLTAPLVAAGSVAIQILKAYGIEIGSHVLNLHGICDDSFSSDEEIVKSQLETIKDQGFPVLNQGIKKQFEKEIETARDNKDSVGGIIETVILNMPAGVGEPFFDSVESRLAHGVFSIGGVKGIEFGLGFDFCDLKGSQVNDKMKIVDKKVEFLSNNNGGILGGLSTGSPIVMKTVIKPTSSIGKKQETINMKTKENIDLELVGRHDPAIIYRASVVVDSVVALVLLDLLLEVQQS